MCLWHPSIAALLMYLSNIIMHICMRTYGKKLCWTRVFFLSNECISQIATRTLYATYVLTSEILLECFFESKIVDCVHLWCWSQFMVERARVYQQLLVPITISSCKLPLIICQQILQSQWISRGCVSSVFTKIFTLCSGACLICKLMLNFANSFSSKWDD